LDPLQHRLVVVGFQTEEFMPLMSAAARPSDHDDEIVRSIACASRQQSTLDRRQEEPFAAIFDLANQ
jgi:hypothetical protein